MSERQAEIVFVLIPVEDVNRSVSRPENFTNYWLSLKPRIDEISLKHLVDIFFPNGTHHLNDFKSRFTLTMAKWYKTFRYVFRLAITNCKNSQEQDEHDFQNKTRPDWIASGIIFVFDAILFGVLHTLYFAVRFVLLLARKNNFRSVLLEHRIENSIL